MSDKFFVEPSPCIEYEGGLSMTCPAGNTMADRAAVWETTWSEHSYILHQALPQVVCQVCDVLIGVDADMAQDSVTFDLTWGPNMVHGEINQNDVMAYEVYFVNADGIIVDSTPAGSVAKPSGQSENVIASCGCDAIKYSLYFANVPVPTGAEALMVVPKDNNGYTMPVGRVILFDDTYTTGTTIGTSDTATTTTTTVTSVTTRTVTTTVAYTVAVDAEYESQEILPPGVTSSDLMSSAAYKAAKKTGLSVALSVPVSRITITDFTVNETARRLSSDVRELSATVSVTTSFRVQVADADAADDLSSTIAGAADAIKTQTNIAMSAADWSGESVITAAPTVTDVAAPVVTAVSGGHTDTTTTTLLSALPPTINSKASCFAQLSVIVLAFLMATSTTSAQL
jgi:hypothetical protein